MLGLPRRLAIPAVALTLLLPAACAQDGPPAAEATTTTIASVTEVGQRRPWDGMLLPPDVGQRYESSTTALDLADLADLGAPNVALMVPLVQDDPTGRPRPRELTTPTDQALGQAMADAARLGLGVVLQVRVEVATPGGDPAPSDPEAWFEAYEPLAVHYAELAQRHGATLVVIGGEVGSLVGHEGWTGVIEAVRAVYDGPVAYAVDAARIDEVEQWDAADVIGVDVAFPPPPDVPEPVAADIEKAWEPLLGRLTELAERWGRPVVLTRVGFPRVEASAEPPAGVGADRQLGAYEGLFTVANQTSAIEGVLVWRWGTDPRTIGGSEATYSPKDRPAEEVLRRAWTTPLAGEDDVDDEDDEESRSGEPRWPQPSPAARA